MGDGADRGRTPGNGSAVTPERRVRVAALLWVVLAVVIWNVIFDRVVVLAGRRYAAAAARAVASGAYLTIDDAMKPAVAHGVRVASAVAIPIALGGVLAVTWAFRRRR